MKEEKSSLLFERIFEMKLILEGAEFSKLVVDRFEHDFLPNLTALPIVISFWYQDQEVNPLDLSVQISSTRNFT